MWSQEDRTFETIEYRGYTIKLIQDEFPFHPREDNPLGTFFVPSGNRNITGDEGAADPNELEKGEIAVLVPVYALVHSGVWLRTGRDFNDVDPGGWDSGCCGAIYLTREKVLEEYGWKVITKARREKLAGYLQNEIATLSDYYEGNVAGYIITDPNGEELESCWGYYPDHDPKTILRGSQFSQWKYLIDECKSTVDYYANKLESFAAAGIGL